MDPELPTPRPLAWRHLALPSLAFITAYVLRFSKPGVLILLHLVWIAAALAALRPLASFLARRRAAAARPLLALALGAWALALATACLSVWIGNASWGADATLKLVLRFAPELGAILEGYGVAPTLGLGAAAAAAAGLFTAAWKLAPRLLARAASPSPLASDRLLAALPLAAALLFTVRALQSWKAWDLQAWDQEPLFNFFAPKAYDQRDAAALPLPALKPARQGSPHVVVIIVDALRADRMGIYGYGRPTTPEMGAWMASGRMRKVAVALAAGNESQAGIFAAIRGVQGLAGEEGAPTLPDFLAGQGYEATFILSGDHAWYGFRSAYGLRQDRFQDGSGNPGFGINDDASILERLRRQLPAFERPQFCYIHLMSTHAVGLLHPAFRRWHPMYPPLWAHLFPGAANRPEAASNLYDNRVLQADHFLGRILSMLEHSGQLGRSLVFILGDHGESLGEEGFYGHTNHFLAAEIRVPLLILDPAGRYRNLDFAAQTDIAPTVAARLGLAAPRGWRGRSLLLSSSDREIFHLPQSGPGGAGAVSRLQGGVIWRLAVKDAKDPGRLLRMDLQGRETELDASRNSPLAQSLRRSLFSLSKGRP